MRIQDLLLYGAAVLGAVTALLWFLSLRLRDVSIVDIFWGCGFAIVAGLSFVVAEAERGRQLAVLIAVVAWGVRLSGYLAWRNLGHGEDRRYQAIRANYGRSFPLLSLFIIFWFQAALVLVVSLPVLATMVAAPGPVGLVQGSGLAIFAVGLLFETVGDLQLARFKADPSNRGRVLDHGLWRYTRHPNYFGDFLVWWGLFVACWTGAGSAWTAVGPIVMSVMLLRVSGVALLEADITERRPAYADYIRRTSAFVPWPPRRASGGSGG